MSEPPYSIPSQDPADTDSLPGLFRHVLNKFTQGCLDDMLPAIVVSVDNSQQPPRAAVRPFIMITDTNGNRTARATIASIPIQMDGSGGYLIRYPVQAGDFGYIKSNDRDLSLFISSLQETGPNTTRMHNFSDGVFIPAVFKNYTIAGEDAENFVIQSLDGSRRIAFWPHQIKVTAEGVGVNGNCDASAVLDVHSTTKAFLPPRMTQTQRDAIPSPKEGMMVWNLTTHGLSTYNGSTWS